MENKRYNKHLYVLFCLFLLMGTLPMRLLGQTFSLKEGATYTCRLTGTGIKPTSVSWMVSNTGILKFTSSTIHAISVDVQAQYGAAGKTGTVTCYYTYEPAYKVEIRTSQTWTFEITSSGPQRIDVSPSSITLDVGEGRWLSASAYPSSASSSVTWDVTSGRDVVSVSSAGYVTAKTPGDAVVTATSTVNGKKGSCSVHVDPVNPTGIEISPSSRQSLAINSSLTFTYSLRPSHATSNVTWSLEGNTNAATLSNGRLTGRAEGSVMVVVTTSNGHSDFCWVDVYKPVPSSISFDNSSRNVTMPVGDGRTLSYSVSPSNAIYTVTWNSDAKDVVSVSQSGYIEAKSPGTAHITVTTDNGKTATTTITVPPQPTAIEMRPASLELIMGRKSQLVYSLKPSNAMARSVTWQSSDPLIASVTQSGQVEARSPGSVVITATTDNGKVGECQLVVPMPLFQLFVWMKNGEKTGYLSTDRPQFHLEGDVVKFSTDKVEFDISQDELDKFTLEQVLPEHPTDISLDREVKVGLGQKVRLAYTLTPADAQTKVTWLNSNPDVISITDGGWATGLQVGTATLKAQTSNGLRAECIITVPEPRHKFYVWLRDGGLEGYAIEEEPLVTMGEEFFTLTTNTSTTITYLANDVLKFTLDDIAVNDPAVGIERLVTKPQEVTFREGEITFSSVRAGSVVSVYDMQGRLVETFHADADGTLNVPLHAYPKGLYIIKTEKSSYKIMKK